MIKGIMHVETRPKSPEDVEAYHRWYDETHLPEILAVPGFVSGCRYDSPDGSFLAIYEVDVDIEQAQKNLAEETAKGGMSTPTGVQLDPPPIVKWMPLRTEKRRTTS